MILQQFAKSAAFLTLIKVKNAAPFAFYLNNLKRLARKSEFFYLHFINEIISNKTGGFNCSIADENRLESIRSSPRVFAVRC